MKILLLTSPLDRICRKIQKKRSKTTTTHGKQGAKEKRCGHRSPLLLQTKKKKIGLIRPRGGGGKKDKKTKERARQLDQCLEFVSHH